MSQVNDDAFDRLCNVELLASLLNLSPRRVQQLAADGVVPKAERGRYHARACVQAYVKHLQERAEGRGLEPGELARAKLINVVLQNEALELQNAERRKELLRAEHVRPQWQAAILAARAHLYATQMSLAWALEEAAGIEAKHELIAERDDEFLCKLAAGLGPDEADGDVSRAGVAQRGAEIGGVSDENDNGAMGGNLRSDIE